jgi:CubicO group peptidase (beta-lactamase class C family)
MGIGTRDSGLGVRDSGFGTRDSGFGTRELRTPHRRTPGPPDPRSRVRRRAWTLLLLLSLSGTAGPVAAQSVPQRFRAAYDSLARLVDSGVVPSIALSVTGRDGVVWESALGAADREGAVKATPLTSYPVASVAKSLTAVGALRAMDRGVLDLDRPVSAYLGDSAIHVPVGDAKRVTTRALLHMTAGIPHVVRFHWADAPGAPVLDAPIGHFAAFPPGRQFHYSNASLGIVGDILARISKRPFARYMAEEVFTPLRLHGSAVRLDALPAHARAKTYEGRPLRSVAFTRLDPEPGAGMYASAHDLGTLARDVFLAPKSGFLSARARAELLAFDDHPFYSAGWWRDPFRLRGLTLVADGAAVGHSASLKVLPEEGVAVAVLTNATVANGFTLGLCDLLLRAAGYGEAMVTRPDLPPEFVDRPVAEDSAWRGTWTGFVQVRDQRVPARIVIDSSGFLGAVGGDATLPPQPVRATASNGVLETRITGVLPSEAVGGQPHTLQIKLRRDGAVLTGYVSASARIGGRPFFMLPYFVSLRRGS